jgi:hypothetical protein
MAAFMNRVTEAGGKTLWLDYVDYAGDLLAGGAIPWLETSRCAAWQRKAQGLLASDVLAMPVARVCSAWLDAHAPLRAAMGAKKRAVFPLKTLLGDEALRSHLVEWVRAVRGSVPGPVLALACPSPRAWVAAAYAQALDAECEVGEDEADSAAPYIADFLRIFGESGIDALLLSETTTSEPATPTEIACYQSVLNVASHYRWDVGLGVPGLRYTGGAAGLDFVIAPAALPGAVTGLEIPAAFWAGAAPPAAQPGSFRHATVPPHADPEHVLERLVLLR